MHIRVLFASYMYQYCFKEHHCGGSRRSEGREGEPLEVLRELMVWCMKNTVLAFHRVPCRPLINEITEKTTKQDDAADNDEEESKKANAWQPTSLVLVVFLILLSRNIRRHAGSHAQLLGYISWAGLGAK